jgi:hypothetical protein
LWVIRTTKTIVVEAVAMANAGPVTSTKPTDASSGNSGYMSSANAVHMSAAKATHVRYAEATDATSAEPAHMTSSEAAAKATTEATTMTAAEAAASVPSATATGFRTSCKQAAGKQCTYQDHHHSSSHEILLELGGTSATGRKSGRRTCPGGHAGVAMN